MSFLDKWFHAGKAALNESGNAALAAHPDAVRHLDQEEAIKKMTDGNEADAVAIQNTKPKMDKAQGDIRGLKRQLADQEKEIADLDVQIDSALTEEAALDQKIAASKDPKQVEALTTERDSYTEAARTLSATKKEKEGIHDVTQQSFAQLQTFVQKAGMEIQGAVKRMADRDKRAKGLGQQLDISETVRTAHDTARSLSQVNLTGVGAASSKAESDVQSMIDTNLGSLDNDDIYNVPADPTQDILEKLKHKSAARTADTDLDARRKKLGLTPAAQPVGASA